MQKWLCIFWCSMLQNLCIVGFHANMHRCHNCMHCNVFLSWFMRAPRHHVGKVRLICVGYRCNHAGLHCSTEPASAEQPRDSAHLCSSATCHHWHCHSHRSGAIFQYGWLLSLCDCHGCSSPQVCFAGGHPCPHVCFRTASEVS